MVNTPLTIGNLEFANRLIQGPLAGYSCAPFRRLFYLYQAPAWCVSEMISAFDLLTKHQPDSRYLYRSPIEKNLCYQIAGTEATIMAKAAERLTLAGADLIDINCGCPKTKIRKKGAGSALLEKPEQLHSIVKAMRAATSVPLTVKIRIQDHAKNRALALMLEEAGADAIIVHGRHWSTHYDEAVNLDAIAAIKAAVTIPVIANGDVNSNASLNRILDQTHCDGVMISRAGTGRPWLYQGLLNNQMPEVNLTTQLDLMMQHLNDLALLEDEYKAVLQGRSLIRYYFREQRASLPLQTFYQLTRLDEIHDFLRCFVHRLLEESAL